MLQTVNGNGNPAPGTTPVSTRAGEAFYNATDPIACNPTISGFLVLMIRMS